MRYFIKGGVWKNSEDEILKAAVMKYGKNQWARISSLLVRKSAKQCKARWYEWLDPSIKKTDWTREEEEKLLHLAKVMPNQWRTIAPIIGRTASQCLEHYEKLLDEAQRELEGGEGSAEELRKLRPGEIDPTPETRPAKPDPVDMDEDEKEMLSEARARLANTRGKKAKRKAREKQLEEAKRLAILQKKRELKAAGLRVGTRIRIKGFNYVEEVPFEKKPPPGFYDVVEEEKESEDITKLLRPRETGQLIEKYEGKRRVDQEAAARKAEAKRRRLFEEQNLPETLRKNYERQREQILKGFARSALKLPEPQIHDEELQMLRKSSEATEEYQMYGKMKDQKVTENLLADYSKTPTPYRQSNAFKTPVSGQQSTMQTPVFEGWSETRRREAKDLLMMNSTQTPLQGGENVSLSNMDFSGVTPQQKTVETPSRMFTPSIASSSPFSTVSASPRYSYLASQEQGKSSNSALLSSMEERAKFKSLRKKLQEGLQSLPAPSNEYKLTVSDDLEEEKMQNTEINHSESEARRLEDAREEAERKRKEEQERMEKAKESWSSAIKLDLPRIGSEGRWLSSTIEEGNTIDLLILNEVDYLLKRDSLKHPLDATTLLSEEELKELEKSDPLVQVPESYFDQAKREVELEMGQMKDEVENYRKAIESQVPYIGVFSKDGQLEGFIKEEEASTELLIGSRRHEMEHLAAARKSVKDNVSKLCSYVDVHHGGYLKRMESLHAEALDNLKQLEETMIKKHCYELAEKNETFAMRDRIRQRIQWVEKLEKQEASLQKRYRELLNERDRLVSKAL